LCNIRALAKHRTQLNNLDMFVKNMFVVDKNFDYKVDEWTNFKIEFHI